MSAIHTPPGSALDSRELQRRAGVFSIVATRTAREFLWLVVAAAFCLLEAIVFFTDLPVSKFFGRRTASKLAGRND